MNDIRGDAEDGFAQHVYFVHQCVDPNVEAHQIIRNADAIRSRIERVAGAAVVEGHFHPEARKVVNGVTCVTVPAICSGEMSSAATLDTRTFMAGGRKTR